MPHLNGDSTPSSAALLATGEDTLDFKTALDVFENESKDGLSVYDLIDSKRNGALTYNDFLVLPGYIGKQQDDRLKPV